MRKSLLTKVLLLVAVFVMAAGTTWADTTKELTISSYATSNN